jgi:hypothetical protein
MERCDANLWQIRAKCDRRRGRAVGAVKEREADDDGATGQFHTRISGALL